MFVTPPLTSAAAGSPDNNAVTTSAVDTTGAKLLVLAVTLNDFLLGSIPSDSASNVWRPLSKPVGLDSSVEPTVQFWYALGTVKTSTAHTFSITSTGKFPSIAALAFAGDPLVASEKVFTADVVEASAVTADQLQTSITATLAPSQPYGLYVAAVSHAGAVTAVTIDSGFTIAKTVQESASAYGLSLAWHAGDVASVSPKFSWTTGTGAALALANFRATTGFRGETL